MLRRQRQTDRQTVMGKRDYEAKMLQIKSDKADKICVNKCQPRCRKDKYQYNTKILELQVHV